jgi:hypothetical protein
MYLDSRMNEEDLLFSPPMPVGRPSKAFLAARTARQAARLAAATALNQVNQAATAAVATALTQVTQAANAAAAATQATPAQAAQAATTATTAAAATQADQPRHRNRNFTVAFKLYVAQYASTHSIRSTALHFGIERSTVRHWLRNQANNQLQNRQHTRFRVSRNDLGQYSEMEAELFDWIVDQRDRGFCVTGGMIRAQALRILEGTNFQASNGWLTRFLRRKRLVIRRVTTSGRELPRDAGATVEAFLRDCEEFMEMDFDLDTLLNGDETSIYIDPPTRRTYDHIGARKVEAVTTGQQKTRVSVCLTATAGGTKLKPLILIPRKNPIKNWTPPDNVEIVYGTNGNFSESVISEHYVPKILVSYKNQRRYHDLHLVFDQAPCHTTQRSKAAFSGASIKVKWVGKRLTYLTQPADQSWMSPFKGRYFKKWNNWLIHAPKSYTAAGNVKSPGYAKVVEWISEAWSELDAGMISSSFQRCGITSRNFADYSNQLRHFMRTTELVDDVVQQDDFHDDDGAFGGDGDDWDSQAEALLDSESDIDENEE